MKNLKSFNDTDFLNTTQCTLDKVQIESITIIHHLLYFITRYHLIFILLDK